MIYSRLHYFTIFWLLISSPFFSSAQAFMWTENCINAYSESSKLNFVKAAQFAQAEKKKHPENLLIPYIESQSDFIQCFVSEDKKDLTNLKIANYKRIDQIEDANEKSPYSRLCIAEYYMQIAVARLKFEEYVSAVYETRKAFKMLEENQRIYPSFKPTLRSLGFIHAVVGAAPKNYQWMMNLMGFHGSIQEGLDELKTLLAATYKQPELVYLRDETIVLLTFLEMNLARDRSNESIRSRFYQIPDLNQKPLLEFAKVAFHFVNAENDSIIDLLSKRFQPPEAYHLNYLDYLYGIARLNSLDYSAEIYFKKYITAFKGKSFIKSSYQRLAWSRLLQGDKAGYLEAMQNAGDEKKGNTFSDEDKQALLEAKSNSSPNLYLLRSRLLFDGGYYQRSLSEIAGKPIALFPSLRDKLEFTYRLARIFEKTNKTDLAIQYYEQTIANGKNYSYYFAANSALMLGILYEGKGDAAKAEDYFRVCLNFRDHEYQNSIDQKAKAGLNRLGKK